ncbi:Uncharacterised protein [Vibrio cholerae]|nr:Uncharacterised protein [Vibrio cholerae]
MKTNAAQSTRSEQQSKSLHLFCLLHHTLSANDLPPRLTLVSASNIPTLLGVTASSRKEIRRI